MVLVQTNLFLVKIRIILQFLLIKHPVLKGKTNSEFIANNLNAMRAACQVFFESETSQKLRRAMKAKTRVSTAVVYQPGDLVYFKKEASNQWKGR